MVDVKNNISCFVKRVCDMFDYGVILRIDRHLSNTVRDIAYVSVRTFRQISHQFMRINNSLLYKK